MVPMVVTLIIASIFAAIFATGCSDEIPGGGARVDAGPSPEDAATRAEAGIRPEDDVGFRDAGFEVNRDVGFASGGDAAPTPIDVGPWRGDPNNPNLDSDCDGLSDAYEFSTLYADGRRTDVSDPDSDGDGIIDGVELGRTSAVAQSGCPPIADADPATRTSPTSPDTDRDGIEDGLEDLNRNGAVDAFELDPNRLDTDNDGLPDPLEDLNRNGRADPDETNGALADTDGDGVPDGIEDRNRDGVRQADESSPRALDTDQDDLSDGVEDNNANGIPEAFETISWSTDTDCDGVGDGDEVLRYLTNPLRADTDGDGLTDGVELGVTSSVAGSLCAISIVPDQDPTTQTNPRSVDSDGDGVRDDEEDANLNGRVDAGELDPLNEDTDGDSISDGDELRLGTAPLDPTDPPAEQASGLATVCGGADAAPIVFANAPQWTIATEPSMAYTAATITAPGVDIDIAGLDGANGIAGFVARMPLLTGAGSTSDEQVTALLRRAGMRTPGLDLALSPRLSGRDVTSHDGFPTSVLNVVDVAATSGPLRTAAARNRILAAMTGLDATEVSGLASDTGTFASNFILSFELRVQADSVLLVAAVLPASSYDDPTDNRSLEMADLTNGTALARSGANQGADCDASLAPAAPKADFIWMADISGSTDDDRENISTAASTIAEALINNNVDFRMGVVRHTENEWRSEANGGGTLFGDGFVRDPDTFQRYLENTDGYSDGCEFGLTAVSNAIVEALPRTARTAPENPRKFRFDAKVVVVYISDEHAQELTRRPAQSCFNYVPCDTGIGDYFSSDDGDACLTEPNDAEQACIDSILRPFIDQLRSPDVDGVSFAQVLPSADLPVLCTEYKCDPRPPEFLPTQDANEPGLGYIRVVRETRGAFYSPCNPNPGAALTAIVDAVAGAASTFELDSSPVSATIRVGVIRLGAMGHSQLLVVPRDKQDGFDYDPAANTIFFRGSTFRPRENDLVIIGYETWQPPVSLCREPCVGSTECDPRLGVCVCSEAVCGACGPNEVCDSECNCICGPDCNKQCGGFSECEPSSCQCICPSNCNDACGPGEVCNSETCACECSPTCGGACDGTLLTCNADTCACECDDCGGQCSGATQCHQASCECVCAPDCDASCPNRSVCVVENDCACACPEGCNGCPDNTECNEETCACECPADCDSQCPVNQVCSPETGCDCVCPADCGGCGATERCNPVQCLCVPAL